MGLQVDCGRESTLLAVDGRADVRVVSEVREALLAALAAPTPAVLDLTAAAATDVAFLQLVLAARASFETQGVPLTVEGEDVLYEAVRGMHGGHAAMREEAHDAG